MLPNKPDYSEIVERLFPGDDGTGAHKRVITFTFQVTTECSLCCSYCYEINKGHDYMSWDVAKRAVDFIFDEAEKKDSIFSYEKISGIIFDFIGGEPLLAIDLITRVIEYSEEQFLKRNSPWIFTHRYSFSTNGVSYFDPRVQKMLSKYSDLISMSVTVDGTKELHDKCRLFPDGRGSYDFAIKAALDQKDKFDNDSTKITLCPANINKTSEAVINMLSLGYKHVFSNCVFEEGWNVNHAKTLYYEMKKIADYILDNDLEDNCAVSLFNESDFVPLSEENDENWCGGTGSMVAIDYKGDFYPCLRYMESSVGKDVKPLIIGNLDDGVYNTPETKIIQEEFSKVTRTSQSTQECLECPIARGCAWCSGYNYQKFGTVNHRATFICVMHKARAIGNFYYWKKEAKKKGIACKYSLMLPKEETVKIIGEEEYQYLMS